MQQWHGSLNFNDTLIALACRERDILQIASFDKDFDQIKWLQNNRHHDGSPKLAELTKSEMSGSLTKYTHKLA
ncbi:MAG: hypothetical protein B6242_12555 [Anaerolineaceae bacterium 4572_78]|nr:MAG: hypothetical protein B6242_12555 [Anaerolineaceae bacterium 4572_78]